MILFKEKRKISVLKNENCHTSNTVHYILQYPIWQYGLWSFQAGGSKLERFLHKNQHTQRKLLNFEFWINGELSKTGHPFSDNFFLKIDFIKKC